MSTVTGSDRRTDNPGDPDVWASNGLLDEFRRFCRGGVVGRYTGQAVLTPMPGANPAYELVAVTKADFDTPALREGVAELVRSGLGLAASSDWARQQPFLATLLGRYATNGVYDFGSVCLNGTWTGEAARPAEDRRLRLGGGVTGVEYLPSDTPYADLGGVGSYPLAGVVWGYKRGWDPDAVREWTMLAKVTVSRTMASPAFSTHREYIYCRAIPEVDDHALWQGRSPAEVDLSEGLPAVARSTAIVGCHKAYGLEELGADGAYTSLDVELDPRTGRVFSVRGARARLAPSLARMPVEHRALRGILMGKDSA